MKSLTAVVIAMALSGCAATLDATYLLAGRHYTESEKASDDTGESTTRQSVALVPEADGEYRLECVKQVFPIVHSGQIDKRYRRQGGYRSSVYKGAAVVDGILGALVAGAALGICTREDATASCWNVLFAAPLVVDLGYGLLRGAAVEDPVLVGKRYQDQGLALAAEPMAEEPTACTTTSVVVGRALRTVQDSVADEAQVVLHDQTVSMPVEMEMFAMSDDALRRLASDQQASLWAAEASGHLRPIELSRCKLLRTHGSRVGLSTSDLETRGCALPKGDGAPADRP